MFRLCKTKIDGVYCVRLRLIVTLICMILFYVDKIVMFVELFVFLEAARSFDSSTHK